MASDDERFMRRAIRLAEEKMAANEGGPFGALIVKDGDIIAEGWNQVTRANDPTAHAEIVAIRRACRRLHTFRLDDCVIYTSCEPCPMCLAAIYWARLSYVYYGNSRGQAAEIGFDDAEILAQIRCHDSVRKLPMIRLLPEEAHRAFDAWVVKPDKTPY